MDKQIDNILNDLAKMKARISALIEKSAHFDCEAVSEKLREANEIISKTARTPRPENLPKNLAWKESFYDGEDFDPFVFDGTMSIEDFKMVQETMIKEGNDEC